MSLRHLLLHDQVLCLCLTARRCRHYINVKVIQATMKRLSSGKCEFVHLGQTFVDVIESTANVNYIKSVVQNRWGSNYILVTADGLEIEDSSGTQGSYIQSCMYVKCPCIQG